jgi:hypothetical protein
VLPSGVASAAHLAVQQRAMRLRGGGLGAAGKGNADVKRGNVSTIRETQTKDRWRLRAANLNDIDGLHALAASPLVYRYLFDGALPDKEYITRLVAQSLANAGETGLGMWFLEDVSTRYAGCVEL